jgi:hypothetical protein
MEVASQQRTSCRQKSSVGTARINAEGGVPVAGQRLALLPQASGQVALGIRTSDHPWKSSAGRVSAVPSI